MLSINALYILILTIFAILVILFLFVITSKYIQGRRYRMGLLLRETALPEINALLSMSEKDWEHSLPMGRVKQFTKKKLQRSIFEEILLELIEEDYQPQSARARTLAYRMELPPLCLAQIGSKNSTRIAHGCHKAGVYLYEKAIPVMLDTLNIFSSDVQIEILMAIAGIGDGKALADAFDRIKHMVLINERTVVEIMESFPGDPVSLYRGLITHEEPYIAGLFLKAVDNASAKELLPEILTILDTQQNKEVHLAAVKALGKTNDPAVTPYLIEALSETEWEVRAVAARLLGFLTDPAAEAPLAKAICDREWWVRQNASKSILAYPNHEPLLEAILREGDSYARDSIFYALESTGKSALLERMKAVCSNTSPTE